MSQPVAATKLTERRQKAWVFFALIGLLGGTIVVTAVEGWRREPAALAWITFGYLGYELGLNMLLVVAAWRGIRARGRRGESQISNLNFQMPAVSVLIAAHNERGCIAETLESVFGQTGVQCEVIVASDGSTDGMVALLADRYGGEERLRVLDLPKLGKGAVLNAALAAARGEVVVTLDADTRLGPGALAALARVFAADERVASAGGFVYVRNADPVAGGTWITRYQFWEYLKNFMWRIGLAHLGVCLQVSGAFGAFRTRVLREELGGFSGHSLVEDYEIIFRLHERMRLAGRAYRVEVVPGAVAWTEGPETVGSFVHQRTRWFAGFLQTMWDYRRLVGDPRMGVLGWFMLPVKCVDAVLPLWGFLSLGFLLAAGVLGGSPGWQRAALGAFLGKWLLDVALSGVMWRWHARMFPERRAGMLSTGRLMWCVATEGLIFNWFRQAAVLNAYGWFVRRVQRWHQPRWEAGGSQSEARSKGVSRGTRAANPTHETRSSEIEKPAAVLEL